MDSDTAGRFQAWLHELGVDEPRRVVRTGPSAILVSKFEEGFAARLLESIDRLPGLFDAQSIGRHVADIGRRAPGTSRVECWRQAVVAELQAAVDAGSLTPDGRAEVEAGVDSVAALLDTALWSGPAFGDTAWRPAEAEVVAFREALGRMDETNGLFTRYYGTFDGLPVENHCPGARIARRLLEQGWAVVTGLPTPAPAT